MCTCKILAYCKHNRSNSYIVHMNLREAESGEVDKTGNLPVHEQET